MLYHKSEEGVCVYLLYSITLLHATILLNERDGFPELCLIKKRPGKYYMYYYRGKKQERDLPTQQ